MRISIPILGICSSSPLESLIPHLRSSKMSKRFQFHFDGSHLQADPCPSRFSCTFWLFLVRSLSLTPFYFFAIVYPCKLLIKPCNAAASFGFFLLPSLSRFSFGFSSYSRQLVENNTSIAGCAGAQWMLCVFHCRKDNCLIFDMFSRGCTGRNVEKQLMMGH